MLSGNVAALRLGVRYVEADLNRLWVTDIGGQPPNATIAEQMEMAAMQQVLQSAVSQDITDAFVLDLHTTSADSAPFLIIGDTLRNRRFARLIPVPVVLGIEEEIDGTLSAYLNEQGFVAINFEAGQHQAYHSVERHEAAIWLALVGAGCLTQQQVSGYQGYRSMLQQAALGLSPVYESRYRFPIPTGHRFIMQPGFLNFDSVQKGQQVASCNGIAVHIIESARLFMPLYQSQGNDGFFLIRPIQPFWLTVSAWVRQLHLDRYLHVLPGVYRRAHEGDSFMVDQRVARFLSLQLFHLLGYRRIRQVDRYLFVSRRKYDVRSPFTQPNR